MIHSDTPVTFTMKQLLTTIAAAIVLCGVVLWTVLSFTIGGMRDDVSAIRGSMHYLQTADRDGAIRIRDTEGKLAEQIGGLRTQLVGLSGKLETVNISISALSERLNDVQKQVASRQASLNDPKTAFAFVETIKKAGLEDSKIVFVPFDASFIPEKK
jgi:hypothetical protein